jgi:hypothetical protein
VRQRRQVVLSFVVDNPWVRKIEVGIVLVEREDLYPPTFIVDGKTDLPLVLDRLLGNPEQQPGAVVEGEYTGIEKTFDLHAIVARSQVGRPEDRVIREAFCDVHSAVETIAKSIRTAFPIVRYLPYFSSQGAKTQFL